MSQEPISPDPELNAIEAALGSLVPSRSRIDRDRLMFRAGQAAAGAAAGAAVTATFPPSPPGRHVWIAIAASLGLVALGEAALLARGPRPRIVERVVVVREPATSPVGPPPERTVNRDPVPPPSPPPGSPEGPPLLGLTARDRLAGQVLRYGLDGLPASPLAARGAPETWTAPSRQRLQEELRKVLESGDPS